MGAASAEFRAGRVLGLEVTGGPDDQPTPVLTQVPLKWLSKASGIVPALTAALTAAAAPACRHAAARRKSARRGLPLVAMPLFGAGRGAGDVFGGELIHHILETAARVGADQGIDVALVLREAPDLAHAHRIRRDAAGTWSQLGPRLEEQAAALARKARAGRLVPFLGAGVSASAGLPLWTDLIKRLLTDSDVPSEQREAFTKLGVLDQAHVLRFHQPDALTFVKQVAAPRASRPLRVGARAACCAAHQRGGHAQLRRAVRDRR